MSKHGISINIPLSKKYAKLGKKKTQKNEWDVPPRTKEVEIKLYSIQWGSNFKRTSLLVEISNS